MGYLSGMQINKNLPYEIISRRIRSLRESQNVTQDSLARHLDISRPTLINYETGKQQISIGDLYSLSVYFKVEISDLLPTTEEILNLSSPDILLEKDQRLEAGSKEEIKDFIDVLRKG